MLVMLLTIIKTSSVLTGSSCTDGSHVQNIKGVSVLMWLLILLHSFLFAIFCYIPSLLAMYANCIRAKMNMKVKV